ncbi:hypothetical protein G9A89_002655 [Geosiphon pyriformis]|nr:hypothetical protein G9A89_002655 [Geosiphon pyriformis]
MSLKISGTIGIAPAINSQSVTFPFYMGLIATNKKTSPILNFLQKKVEIEIAKKPKAPLENWFPPVQQAESLILKKLKVFLPKDSERNLGDNMSLQNQKIKDKNDLESVSYTNYIGLEGKKGSRYLKTKANILNEPIPYEFTLNLEYLLPPVGDKFIKPRKVKQKRNEFLPKGKVPDMRNEGQPTVHKTMVKNKNESKALKPAISQKRQSLIASKPRTDSKIGKSLFVTRKKDKISINDKTWTNYLKEIKKFEQEKPKKTTRNSKNTPVKISQSINNWVTKLYNSSKITNQASKLPNSCICVSSKNKSKLYQSWYLD